MYCPNCGTKIQNHDKFCVNCGKALKGVNYYENQNRPMRKKMMCCPRCRSNELYSVKIPEYNFHLNDDFVFKNSSFDSHFWKCYKCSDIIIDLEDLTKEISKTEDSIEKHKKIRSILYFLAETITLIIFLIMCFPLKNDSTVLIAIIVDAIIGLVLNLCVYYSLKPYIEEKAKYLHALNEEKAYLTKNAYYIQ